MRNKLLDIAEQSSLREEPLNFAVGDTIDVHTRILEGSKERVQIFSGVVIARRGHGTGETFTVRRIVAGEGVERTFPSTRQRSPRSTSNATAECVVPSCSTSVTVQARPRVCVSVRPSHGKWIPTRRSSRDLLKVTGPLAGAIGFRIRTCPSAVCDGRLRL